MKIRFNREIMRRDLAFFLVAYAVAIAVGIFAHRAVPLRGRRAADRGIRRLRAADHEERGRPGGRVPRALLPPHRGVARAQAGDPADHRGPRGHHLRRRSVRARTHHISPRPSACPRWSSPCSSRPWRPSFRRSSTASCGCGRRRTRWPWATSPAPWSSRARSRWPSAWRSPTGVCGESGEWHAAVAAGLALLSGAILYGRLRFTKKGFGVGSLLFGGVLYAAFLGVTLWSIL